MKEGYEERDLEKHACTHGGDRSEEQERPNLKIISGSAEINRANRRAHMRKRENERERERRD